MSIINTDEIFARIHKYKIFRSEGNLYIDVYEAILGKPANKFMAIPNLIFREAEKEYFGIGESQKEALKDCLKKIKDVPINEIVPPETQNESSSNTKDSSQTISSPESRKQEGKLGKLFSKNPK